MEVKVVESSMVTPSEETPQKDLWLSPLDLMAPRGHTPTVYFYRCAGGDNNFFFDVARMKAALAKALVSFYPLAGRIGDGRVEVNCGGQGVLFNVANTDLTVHDFDMYKPSPEHKRLFVPRIESSPGVICAAQLTFFRCGGVALGLSLHHFTVDAASAFHFIQTWASICRDGDKAIVEPPCHDRTLLRARSPPVVHPDALSVFCPMLKYLCEPSGVDGRLGCGAFVISKEQVAALKRACGGARAGVSTFCALSAHVWQCVCATGRAMPPDGMTRLTFQANVRRSMRPALPKGYFGNGIIRLGVTGVVREIGSDEVSAVAGRIKDAIRKMDDELVRSAIDYLELQLQQQAKAKAKAKAQQGSQLQLLPTTELAMVSWLGMPVYETADFGWGKPLVMLRAGLECRGRVHLMDGGMDGSVRLLVCLDPAILNDFHRMLYAKLN